MAESSTKPCRKCGATDRNPSGNCRPCTKSSVETWRTNNREDYQASERARSRARYAADPTVAHAKSLRQKYDVSLNEYNDQLAAQGGVCAICRRPEVSTDKNGKLRKLAVDHDHVTGTPRGLLCSFCNGGLGRFYDNPVLLRAAADYLEASR